jgi:alpha-beta hydrolase superfamily lysophospholipase
MAKKQEFSFSSADGIHQCFAKEWLPEIGAPKAVLQIVHGVAEYIERYDAFACYLADHGFLVTGEDHLGHGRTVTDEQYGFFAEENGWELVANDIHKLRVIQGEKYPGIPYFILGHSMGSLLTRFYLINWPGTITGAIISGTGQMATPVVLFGKWFAERKCKQQGAKSVNNTIQKLSFGAYNKQFAPVRTDADWISRDEEVVNAYVADPLCQFSPSVGMSRDILSGIQYITNKANLKRMDPLTPLYFFSGDKDPFGGNGKGVHKVYGLFKNAGCTDMSMKLYPEGRHEMLNETNREEVYANTLTWLEKYI